MYIYIYIYLFKKTFKMMRKTSLEHETSQQNASGFANEVQEKLLKYQMISIVSPKGGSTSWKALTKKKRILAIRPIGSDQAGAEHSRANPL
jgi:hypothetical protein